MARYNANPNFFSNVSLPVLGSSMNSTHWRVETAADRSARCALVSTCSDSPRTAFRCAYRLEGIQSHDTIALMTEASDRGLASDIADTQNLNQDERLDLQEATSEVNPVAYSGQDFDVEGLVRRLIKHDIKIPQFGHEDEDILSAGFQRSFVWNRPQMDRFIESLLLGFPIPGIFLVRQVDKRYLVLDGQQRLKTLEYFYRGVYDGREFALRNVATQFVGLTYATLSPHQQRTLDNAFIQATIVDTDGTDASLDAIYQIFERLNSGGTQLTAHEIRVALYAGPLIDYFEQLNRFEAWRALYGAKNQRIRDQELIVRIVSLFLHHDRYSRPQKTFLNKFVAENRNGPSTRIAEAGQLFIDASKVLLEGPGPDALRRASRQINNSQTDSVYVGLMSRLLRSPISPAECAAAIETLRMNPDFQGYVSGPTADEEMVRGRLRIATAVFASA
jgi:hypothetical protein